MSKPIQQRFTAWTAALTNGPAAANTLVDALATAHASELETITIHAIAAVTTIAAYVVEAVRDVRRVHAGELSASDAIRRARDTAAALTEGDTPEFPNRFDGEGGLLP